MQHTKVTLLITLISKNKFTTYPWKSGKGKTTELAINKGASLAHFDWRISIAEVTEDGFFSDFSGYQRNLVLIDGHEIKLCHDQKTRDHLTHTLDFATFSGDSSTHAVLPSGPIVDFNIITKTDKYQVHLSTHNEQRRVAIAENGLSFAYSLASDLTIIQPGSAKRMLRQGDLLQIENEPDLTVHGTKLIIVHLITR